MSTLISEVQFLPAGEPLPAAGLVTKPEAGPDVGVWGRYSKKTNKLLTVFMKRDLDYYVRDFGKSNNDYRPLDADDWHLRERSLRDRRMLDYQIYGDMPTEFRSGAAHLFATPSEDKKLVSFFASVEHIRKRRRTQMKPGKFFKDYIGGDAERGAAIWAEAFSDPELKITTTAEEAARVYNNGPSSCMGGNGKWSQDRNPAAVYSGPDLFVAYIQREGRITARAVVWPERKVYNTIYGDVDRMRKALRNAGYNQNSLQGAKIKKLPVPKAMPKEYHNLILLPYLDGTGYAEDNLDGTLTLLSDPSTKDFSTKPIYVHSTSGIPAVHSCGLSRQYFPTSQYFRALYQPPKGSAIHVSKAWIEASKDHFYCPVSKKYYPVDQRVENAEGGFAAKAALVRCAGNGLYYRRDRGRVSPEDGNFYSDAFRTQTDRESHVAA